MKKNVDEVIFTKDYVGEHATVRFSDFPADIQPNDIIEIRREPAFYSENNSYDSFTELVVIREREETDDEYEKRKIKEAEFKEELKRRRYETYLKLKKEFSKGFDIEYDASTI